MTHEDERRTLTSIPYKKGEIKIIVAKQDCELGHHFHKIKTEEFRLIKGPGIITRDHFDDKMLLYTDYIIEPNIHHSFFLKKDSILFCICSHPYNQKDDYGI